MRVPERIRVCNITCFLHALSTHSKPEGTLGAVSAPRPVRLIPHRWRAYCPRRLARAAPCSVPGPQYRWRQLPAGTSPGWSRGGSRRAPERRGRALGRPRAQRARVHRPSPTTSAWSNRDERCRPGHGEEVPTRRCRFTDMPVNAAGRVNSPTDSAQSQAGASTSAVTAGGVHQNLTGGISEDTR